MKTILKYSVVVIVALVTYGSYIYFASTGGSPDEVTFTKNINGAVVDPLGKLSDGSFDNYVTAAEFELRPETEFLTVTASDIKETDLYMRKGWVGATIAVRKRVSRRRSRAVDKHIPRYAKFSITERKYMVPIYIITLADGGEVGATLESKYVSALKDGETVTLPIGNRVDVSPETEEFFAKKSNGGGEITSIYYSLNDEWYLRNSATVDNNAIMYAGAVFLVMAGLLALFARKLFQSDEDEE